MTATYRPLRPKLISNAPAGRSDESPRQLANIVTEMQTRKIWPEVFWVRPDSRVAAVDHNTVRRGITLIDMAGGEPVLIKTARRQPAAAAGVPG